MLIKMKTFYNKITQFYNVHFTSATCRTNKGNQSQSKLLSVNEITITLIRHLTSFHFRSTAAFSVVLN